MSGQLIRKMNRYVLSRLGNVLCGFRRRWVNFTHVGVKVEAGVRLMSGVRFSVTDGGVLTISTGTIISEGTQITVKGGRISIGPHSFVGPWTVLCANQGISIGANALIAERVTIRDQNHNFNQRGLIKDSGMDIEEIFIGEDVWVAANAVILKGVRIGRGSVVGANSVVNADVQQNSIVAGAPARLVKFRNMHEY